MQHLPPCRAFPFVVIHNYHIGFLSLHQLPLTSPQIKWQLSILFILALSIAASTESCTISIPYLLGFRCHKLWNSPSSCRSYTTFESRSGSASLLQSFNRFDISRKEWKEIYLKLWPNFLIIVMRPYRILLLRWLPRLLTIVEHLRITPINGHISLGSSSISR